MGREKNERNARRGRRTKGKWRNELKIKLSLCLTRYHAVKRFFQALGPTHLPIQWIPGVFTLGIKRPGRGAALTLHNTPLWRGV
jgi:hypothetical protein